MQSPLYIAGLIRAELLRARCMAQALARNIAQLLDNADTILPFALTQLDDVLADDVVRLLGGLQGAQDQRGRLTESQITALALAREDNAEAGPAELAA